MITATVKMPQIIHILLSPSLRIGGSLPQLPLYYRGADKSLARPGGKQVTATEDLSFIYPVYNHNWRNIITIYITRLAFGPKRDEVTGEWRKLHNEELSDLYSLPSIVRVVKSRRMRWAGHVALMGEGRGVHRVLVGKPEGKRPLGRPRRRWEDNIKINL